MFCKGRILLRHIQAKEYFILPAQGKRTTLAQHPQKQYCSPRTLYFAPENATRRAQLQNILQIVTSETQKNDKKDWFLKKKSHI